LRELVEQNGNASLSGARVKPRRHGSACHARSVNTPGKSRVRQLQETGIADAINDGGPYDSARNEMMALDFATQLQEMKAIAGQPDFALGSVHAITRDGTLAARHRSHDPERLRSRGDLVRHRIVGGIERDVAAAGKEANEIPALRGPMIANRPAQDRIARLQRVDQRALRRPLLGVEGDLSVDARKGPQVLRKHNADHGSVCASTESTAGRSRTIAVHLSPPSGDA
jgi:hypothetical protein